jgi:hypothetical protein
MHLPPSIGICVTTMHERHERIVAIYQLLTTGCVLSDALYGYKSCNVSGNLGGLYVRVTALGKVQAVSIVIPVTQT